jgi:hypothetical protein
MPNPLSQVKPDAHIDMGPYAMFARPKLAALVSATIAHWSYIETTKAEILGRLLGRQKSVGIALYLAVRSPTAQRAILDDAVAECMQPVDRPLYAAVMKAVAASQRRRNEFAHHLWGYSDDLPNALLLVDNKTSLSFERSLLEHNAGRLHEPAWTAYPAYDLSQVIVFTEDDLEQSAMEAGQAAEWVYLLLTVASRFEHERARQELFAEPRIQQFLRSQSSENPP